jgi:(R,R)-butanediol dehydrogenase/meso-butanediol dehydrogenase/diacetyl reductase
MTWSLPRRKLKAGDFGPVIDLINDGRLNAEAMITGKIKLDDIIDKGFRN